MKKCTELYVVAFKGQSYTFYNPTSTSTNIGRASLAQLFKIKLD